MVDNLQMILEQMNNIKEQMAGIQDHFDERMTTHERMVTNHFGSCKELCMIKIAHVEASAEKAHTRLDKHKHEIMTICDWKNQMAGRMWVLPFIITMVVSIIVGVSVFYITKTFGG